jgi:ABC-2 type transport system ATP-binding protein
MQNKPILSINSLSKIYPSKPHPVHALDDVTFDIQPGTVCALLGVNGAGKTTLSSIIATLHPPTSGDILFHGQSIYRDIMSYRYAIGYCPQSQNLDMALTVKENLEFAGRYFLMSTEHIKKRVEELLATFNLNHVAHREINTLSGGTKQRVLLARALVHSPQIVILDEPTVGLDPDIRRKLWEHILHLKTQGITVIITTHYLDEADVLADTICILHGGKLMVAQDKVSLKQAHDMAPLETIFLSLLGELRNNED